MANPYVYRGAERDYHFLGHVEDGDVAYFDNRPPDDRWQPYEGEQPDEPVSPAKVEAHEQFVAAEEERDAAEKAAAEELKQPNKAASAQDWKAYAAAHGGFEETTGTHPDDATRKEIVEHYTAEGDAPATQPSGDQPPADTQE